MQESLQVQISIPDTSDQLNDMRANLLQSALNNIDWPINKTAKIVVLGLSGAGKSTLIEFVEKGAVEVNKRRPTLAFSYHHCDFGRFKAVFVDVPGQKIYWSDWKTYMKGVDGVIFVIDATKLTEVAKANEIYRKTMNQLENIPVVFLANKQDLESAISADAISRLMSLHNEERETKAFDTVALTGNGLYPSIVWLLNNAKK